MSENAVARPDFADDSKPNLGDICLNSRQFIQWNGDGGRGEGVGIDSQLFLDYSIGEMIVHEMRCERVASNES